MINTIPHLSSLDQLAWDWAPSLELENMDQKETETTEDDPHKSSTRTSLLTTYSAVLI
jgi:hypothetical protein